MEKEVRTYDVSFEVRNDSDKPAKLRGLAIAYNKMSEDLGFREVIATGALKRALDKNPDVLALYEHSSANLLARVSNDTLKVEETERGLEVEIELPETTLGKDIGVLVANRTLSKMSFGFSLESRDSSEWSLTEAGEDLRTINHIDNLYEVSLVSSPAYTDTGVAMRCLGECRDAEAEKKAGKTEDPVEMSAEDIENIEEKKKILEGLKYE